MMHTEASDAQAAVPAKKHTLCIGITGGVGCGKSAVMDHLSHTTDCRIIISDDEAKKLYTQDSPIFGKIIEAAGEDITDGAGELDRKKLAARLFERKGLREEINSIVHPAVMDLIDRAVETERESGRHDFLFVEAALLIECGYDRKLDELWYVYASEETRRRRLKENRGYSDEKTAAMMRAQMDEAGYREHCIRVIDNNGSIEDMRRSADEAVRAALGRYGITEGKNSK